MEDKLKNVVFVLPTLSKYKAYLSQDFDSLLDSLSLNESTYDAWIYTTYVYLKVRGFKVNISDKLVKNHINIIHYDHFGFKEVCSDCYVVSVKADRNRTFISNYEIIQSPYSSEHDKDIFIHHWPEANIIVRDSSRGSKVENLVYYGRKYYLPDYIETKNFKEKLEKLGVNLKISDVRSEWKNYKEADIVLSVRKAPSFYRKSKPASKLVNAWLAGVPAIVDSDPICNYLKKTDFDYISANSEKEMLEAIALLKEDAVLYEKMVTNSKKRAEEFTIDKIADMWINALSRDIYDDFLKWKKMPYWILIFKQSVNISRRFIRGSLYDLRTNKQTGKPVDKTTFARKMLWCIFDKFAWKSYKQTKSYISSQKPESVR